MVLLNITVEGQTEEKFVKTVLAPHLSAFNVIAKTRIVRTSKDNKCNKIFQGGATSYVRVKNEISWWMKEKDGKEAYFSTMFDLYKLPDDFPSFEDAKKIADPYLKVESLEKSFGNDIGHYKFIPYIQLHEFEALLFSQLEKFKSHYRNNNKEIDTLIKEISKTSNPELINDGPDTAPSKRIIKHLKFYESQKATAGPIIANSIGLDILRSKCAHFNEWLQKLEKLGSNSKPASLRKLHI